MSIIKHHKYSVPGLNAASLPDLIFTVLFFFMVVTHMQKVAVRVRYQVPQGTSLTRLTKKSAVTYIYIGRAADGVGKPTGQQMCVQLNDKFASPEAVADYVSAERARMSPADQQQMTVSIKADRHTPLGLINRVRLSLRQAKALRISYSATEGAARDNK